MELAVQGRLTWALREHNREELSDFFNDGKFREELSE
jgi:hypothetical protein